MPPKHLYFIGTAGSGKSMLTNTFGSWLKSEGYDSIAVNLDPGCDSLPYEPDVDVRDWISIPEIMAEHSLGPNGAQVLAADMLALNIREVARVIEGFETDYVLLDTPGQLELFAFRQSSKVVVNALGTDMSMLAYLFDPVLVKDPNGLVTSLLLSLTVHFRMPLPMMTVLAKADLLSELETDAIQAWSQDPQALWNVLCESSVDAQTQISLEFLQAIDAIGSVMEPRLVSSATLDGMADIYSAVQQVLEGGEDIDR